MHQIEILKVDTETDEVVKVLGRRMVSMPHIVDSLHCSFDKIGRQAQKDKDATNPSESTTNSQA